MPEKIIPYSRQCIEEDDIRMVQNILKSDFITQGPVVDQFEEKLAEKVGSRHAVVLSSGTSALHAAYFAAGIGPGDEIITSALTFASTANVALHLGAKVVFADTEADTGNLDVDSVRKKITEKTKLIVPVHFGGHPVDLAGFNQLTSENNIRLIEDGSHALGSQYNGMPVGNCKFSEMVTASFHPVKHMTTGEGGVVFTNDEGLYDRMKAFRHHGIIKPGPEEGADPWYYEMHFLGYNYRLTDIQAGLGISQLGKLDRFVQRRREIASRYHDAFRENEGLVLPVEKEYARSAYHLYPIRLTDPAKRAKVFRLLRENNIWVQVHYIPVYLHPYYRQLGYERGICSNTEDYYNRMISIPVFPSLTEEEQDRVIDLVNRFVNEG